MPFGFQSGRDVTIEEGEGGEVLREANNYWALWERRVDELQAQREDEYYLMIIE